MVFIGVHFDHYSDDFFSSRMVRLRELLIISSNLEITRLSYLTSSFGLGNSLNLTVFMSAF